MIALLMKNFLRSKGFMAGLMLLFLAGLLSLYIGKHFLEKNREIIEKTAHFQQENLDRYAKNIKEMGSLLYYVRFGLANETSDLAGLSIGQRDINPAVMSVTIRNLQEQKYNTDLINPMYQLIGNLDFSFVLIYLFPLIIIAFGFNLISEEKEEGTWSLVLSQANSPQKMLWVKMGIRYLSVLAVLLLLFLIAKLYLTISFDAVFVAYILSALLYTSFWFCVVWLVVSFHKNSSQNALMLLTSWVLLTIVIPASVNAVIVNLYPVPEAFSTVLESRDGYHTQWDKPKEPTIQHFYQRYPQYRIFKHPEGADYSSLWYYAMQQLGDDESVSQANALKDKLMKRETVSNTIGLVIPTIHTQLMLNSLSQSDIRNYLNFNEKLADFHEQKKLYFFPKMFGNVPVAEQNWKMFPLQYFQDRVEVQWLKVLLPFIIISGLCLLWAQSNFSKNGSLNHHL
jgi:ABC-2 type transport system permease protein